MSKETTKARIQEEITSAIANNSITPTIVGGILDEILELPVSLPYKVYTATLTQRGTENPVANVFENTLTGVLQWTRLNTGDYLATLIGQFESDNVVIMPVAGRTMVGSHSIRNEGRRYDYDSIEFFSYDLSTNQLCPDGFNGQFVEIRVYN
jgi:hypothetical protein